MQRNKFYDTIFFLVVTLMQCIEVHGPLCLLRYNLIIQAIEILCRMKVEKGKGMTNHTSFLGVFLNNKKKPTRKKKGGNF